MDWKSWSDEENHRDILLSLLRFTSWKDTFSKYKHINDIIDELQYQVSIDNTVYPPINNVFNIFNNVCRFSLGFLFLL